MSDLSASSTVGRKEVSSSVPQSLSDPSRNIVTNAALFLACVGEFSVRLSACLSVSLFASLSLSPSLPHSLLHDSSSPSMHSGLPPLCDDGGRGGVVCVCVCVGGVRWGRGCLFSYFLDVSIPPRVSNYCLSVSPCLLPLTFPLSVLVTWRGREEK